MVMYRYKAKDAAGRTLSNTAEAIDERTLVNLLRKQQLTVIQIEEEKKEGAKKAIFSTRKKIKMNELVIFSRQLSTMIDSGIPLVHALEILTEQVENPEFKRVLSEVKKDVTAGTSFHDALAKHPHAFSHLFVSMVKAGEASGSLDEIMDRLATYFEKSESLVRKVRSAMIYPIVVTLMAIGITLVMIMKVVPVFKSMFADFGGVLPAPTQMLINLSEFLIKFFYLWAGGLFGLFVGIQRFLATPGGRAFFDRFKLNSPVFGDIIRKVAITKFTRTLSTLIKSGVPILAALEIVEKTAGNTVIETAITKVRASINEGENMSAPLMRSKVFPPLVVRMIGVGEQTGELEKMCNKIADFYDDQVDVAVSGLTSLMEPLIIAFLGVVVGGIVICMFLPIFKISTLISAIIL